jgi:hypothetical protein
LPLPKSPPTTAPSAVPEVPPMIPPLAVLLSEPQLEKIIAQHNNDTAILVFFIFLNK